MTDEAAAKRAVLIGNRLIGLERYMHDLERIVEDEGIRIDIRSTRRKLAQLASLWEPVVRRLRN